MTTTMASSKPPPQKEYAVHLYRFSRCFGWQKYHGDDGTDGDETTIRVVLHRFYVTMPDLRTRLWLVEPTDTTRVTSTAVRRGDRVKIAAGATTILVLVFRSVAESVDFCDLIARNFGPDSDEDNDNCTTRPERMATMADPAATTTPGMTTTTSTTPPQQQQQDQRYNFNSYDPHVQYASEREEEEGQRRGADVLSYAANLLTDHHFLELVQKLERALTASDDGRAFLEQFVQDLSRPI